jgi:hypothetical protein
VSSRKALVITSAVVSALALGTGTAAAKPVRAAATTVTIRSVPGGIYGYVTSPAVESCAAGRKIEVLEQQGDQPDPAADRRIATTRAEGVGGDLYQWSIDTGGSNRLYARAAARHGCAAALSGAAPTLGLAAPGDPGAPSYPPCSPYVDEGTSETCELGLLYAELREESFLSSCSFGDARGNCPGQAGGIFPWGTTSRGQRPGVRLYWTPSSGATRNVSLVSFQGIDADGEGAAFLSGTMSWSGSDSFTVTDAWAQNELGGNYGDHFKTLSLPGREPGEVGGPLKINCRYEDSKATLQCWINGYLELRR